MRRGLEERIRGGESMTPDEWIAAGATIDEMRGRGFFMAVWSPGEVTNGRTYYSFEQWRVQFQRGAMEAAPLMDCEGFGEADTFLEAVKKAAGDALVGLLEWEKSYEGANGVRPSLTGRDST
jgi:hypothetical protein